MENTGIYKTFFYTIYHLFFYFIFLKSLVNKYVYIFFCLKVNQCLKENLHDCMYTVFSLPFFMLQKKPCFEDIVNTCSTLYIPIKPIDLINYTCKLFY